MEHYILTDDHKTTPVDALEWDKYFETSDRRVALDNVGDVRISTVFLGLDHSFGYGPPLLFETLVFGGELDKEMERYTTWDEAVKGHKVMVKRVEEAEA